MQEINLLFVLLSICPEISNWNFDFINKLTEIAAWIVQDQSKFISIFFYSLCPQN